LPSDKTVHGLLAIITLVLVIVSGVYVYNTYLQTRPKPTPVGAPNQLAGKISLTVSEKNAFNDSANAGSSSSYAAYHIVNAAKGIPWPITSKNQLTGMVSLSSSAADFGIGPQDNVLESNGWHAYFVVRIDPGSADYLDPEMVVSRHAWVLKYDASVDITGDNKPDYLFLCDASPIGVSQEGMPATLVSYLYPADTSLTINHPSDITGVGTTASKTVEWKVSFSSDREGKATMLARIYVVSNDTQTNNFITFSEMTVQSFDGTLLLNKQTPFDEDRDSSSYTGHYYGKTGGSESYLYTVNGLLCKRPEGSASSITITLRINTAFQASGNAVQVTIYIVPISSNNVLGSTVSDTVVLSY
jgi:hypothetical protein